MTSKEYDHEDDRSDQPSEQNQQDRKRKMLQLQQEYNHAKLTADVNELYMHHKTHDLDIRHLQKDVECRVTQSQLSQVIALINAGIQTDPNMMKLLKSKQTNIDEQENNKIKLNAMLFSKKLNQISESLSVLLGSIRKLDVRINGVEADLTAQLNQKHSSQQIQIQQARNDQIKETMELQQKMQLMSFELTDKMRDVDTKLNWRLNEFKQKIDDKISEELVMSYLEDTVKRVDKNMREYQLKSNISPERVEAIEKAIEENRVNGENGITQCKYKLEGIREEIDQQLLKTNVFEENRLLIEKRMELFNSNFEDVYTRVKGCEGRQLKLDQNVTKLLHEAEYSVTELKRINLVLLNLKIGDDFQKMLEEMNPAKVLQLQDRVDDVHNEQTNIFRAIQHANRQIHKINAKTDIMGVMQPNKARQKLKKEELEEALTEYLSDHQFSQKISNIDRELNNYKLSVEAVNLLTKQVARLQKQSNTHKLYNDIRCLQENIKKQLLIIHGQLKERINYKEYMFNARPVSKGTSNSGGESPVVESNQGRSFSVKKIQKITSFFDNAGQKSLIDKKTSKA